MTEASTQFTKLLGIQYPLICGAMYPCSNPELVAAASEEGGIGIVQPLSLTYVHGYEFKTGLKFIRSLTKKPIGLNALVEKSSQKYLDRMYRIVDEAIEEGIRFFVTALGNPKEVVARVHAMKGIVFHDVTERKWALRALEAGVDGLICVNKNAGGHAGQKNPQELFDELRDLKVPLVCAGGVGSRKSFDQALAIGYGAVQLGTRFLASKECKIGEAYKSAIVAASENDIVLTEKLTGVPVAVINTPRIQKLGTKASGFAKWLLKHPKGKHWMRLYYSLKSFLALKRSIQRPNPYLDYWQAGKSVADIEAVLSVKEIFKEFV